MLKPSDYKILIVGAGIGGLALAIQLKQLGFNPEIIDRAHRWHMKGYSLTLWPNALKVLDSIGIGNNIRKESKQITGTKVLNKYGQLIGNFSFRDFNKKFKGPYQVYRVDLHRELREKASDIKIKLNTQVEKIREKKDKVSIVFSNGKRSEYDFVIAADGIHSSIRKKIFPKVKEKYLGVTGWLFWLPHANHFPKNTTLVLGDRKMFALYDHGDHRHLVGHFAMMDKYQGENSPAHRIHYLKQEFGDMKGLVQNVLRNLPHDNDCFFHYDHVIIDSDRWHTNRIVFLGDAIHATSPFSAMGAAMALEDSYVLAEEISKSKNFNDAFPKYFKRRYKRVQKITRQANAVEMLLKTSAPINRVRDFLLKQMFEKIYLYNMKKIIMERI